jgi:hypothetical protein
MISRFSPATKVKNSSSNEKPALLSQLVQNVEQSKDAFELAYLKA